MKDGKRLVFVGTWGKQYNNHGKGVYTLEMDKETGALELIHTLDVREPSVLAVSPDGKYLFSTNELTKGFDDISSGGGVTAMKIAEDGSLSIINQTSSLGSIPCYLEKDPSGQYVVVAIHSDFGVTSRCIKTNDGQFILDRTYDEAGIALFKVMEDGSLCPKDFLKIDFPGSANFYQKNPERADRGYPWNMPIPKSFLQSHPYVHCIAFINDELFFASDRGTDKVYLCSIDRELDIIKLEHIVSIDLGQAARHMVIHPTKPYMYMTHEIEPTMDVFEFDVEKRCFWRIQTEAAYDKENAPADARVMTCDIHIHPSGNFLYTSNRGTNDLVVYDICPDCGKVTRKQVYPLGKAEPRSIQVTSDGKFLVVGHKETDEIETLKVNEDGTLAPTGHIIKADTPCCIRFLD